MVIYLGPPLLTASSGAFIRNGANGQPPFLGLALSRVYRASTSRCCWCALPHFGTLAVPANRPSAVFFCGTVLTVTRTGRYPASLAIRSPDFPQPILKEIGRNHLAYFRIPSCLVGIIHRPGAVAQPDRATVS